MIIRTKPEVDKELVLTTLMEAGYNISRYSEYVYEINEEPNQCQETHQSNPMSDLKTQESDLPSG